MTRVQAPNGTWKSPLTSDEIAAKSIGLSEPRFDGKDVYWLENRRGQLDERPRVVIVRRDETGTCSDAIDSSFSARNTVHEYGGGSYAVAGGNIYFTNYFDGGQLYGLPRQGTPSSITSQKEFRYADLVIDRKRNRLICVREDHTLHAVKNEVVSVSLDGSGTVSVLLTGNDFYSSPRISPDGTRMAWLTWNFPHMPWTNAQLWTSEFDIQGTPSALKQVAGDKDESVFQPEWSPDGTLYFVSDISGWWNLYRWQGTREAIAPMEADFGQAQWHFGLSTYSFVSAELLVCAYVKSGIWRLGLLETTTLKFKNLNLPFQEISYVQAQPGRAIFCAGSPTQTLSIVQLDLDSYAPNILRSSLPNTDIFASFFSVPQPIEFPTSDGKTAHAFYYPPANPNFTTPLGKLPPLLVKTHGGPTAASTSTLDLRIQYWTSRGFAVVDVNYGGSTGYGRDYRLRLRQQWGVVDLNDCVNSAQYLVDQGLVDAKKLAITGTSAGGYTTLCALTFRSKFCAGASHYGIADLEKFIEQTHKFESRYVEWLIGPYPEQAEIYRQRSPLRHADLVRVPVIFFQGEDDRIVPSEQSAAMSEALKKRNIPYRYILLKGEQHGFRSSANIKKVFDDELDFYTAQLL